MVKLRAARQGKDQILELSDQQKAKFLPARLGKGKSYDH